jgi:hypothetical protein
MSAPLRYPWRALAPDYLRAAVGFGFTAVPLVLVPSAPVVTWILAGMAGLFAVFAVRTGFRHVTAIELDEERVVAHGPIPRRLAWRTLSGMRLAYYATRRDRKHGWMQLRLRGNQGGFTVDSGIDRFSDIVRMAYRAARANGVRLSETTLANVAAMGLADDRPEVSGA